MKLSYKEGLDDALCDEIYLLREALSSQLTELIAYQKEFVSTAERKINELNRSFSEGRVDQLNKSFSEKTHELERLGEKVHRVLEQSDKREAQLIKFFRHWLLVLGIVSLIGILYWVFLSHQIADRRAQLSSITRELKHTPTIIPKDDDDYIRIIPDSGIKVDKGSPLDGLYAKVDYS